MVGTSAAAAAVPEPAPERAPRGGHEAAALLARANAMAAGKARTGGMLRAVDRASELGGRGLDPARELPVAGELAGLLPPGWAGLRRGSAIAVPHSASVLLALLGGAMASTTSWAAIVGGSRLGIVAATEYGIPVGRLALVRDPGPEWPSVVAALIDGVDLVVIDNGSGPVPLRTARSLVARARQRGAVLLPTGEGWPEPDLSIEVAERTWRGIGRGHGRLSGQKTTLRAQGRGAAQRPRTIVTALPPTSLAAAAASASG
jgi:hypothetical protein